jgi:IS30 family transposase
MARSLVPLRVDERRIITCWRMAGLSVVVIAEKLDRHRSPTPRKIKTVRSLIALFPIFAAIAA